MNANSSKSKPPIGSLIRTKRVGIEGTVIYYTKKHGTMVIEWDTGGVSEFYGDYEVISENSTSVVK